LNAQIGEKVYLDGHPPLELQLGERAKAPKGAIRARLAEITSRIANIANRQLRRINV
jgi:hypothetical protein